MCLIALAWRSHPDYDLVFAANRDEFHARATDPAAFWADAPQVFAGRDLEAGGTWCGVGPQRRFAAVTNVREPAAPAPGARSRGHLVADYLGGAEQARGYCARLAAEGDAYSGFNLLVGDGEALLYLGNRDGRGVVALEAGVHTLSNGVLGDDWPKTRRAASGLQAALDAAAQAGASVDPDAILAVLADDTPAATDELPDTGVGADLERRLSPIFVRGAAYGTRASTVILRRRDGRLRFVEQGFGPQGEQTQRVDECF